MKAKVLSVTASVIVLAMAAGSVPVTAQDEMPERTLRTGNVIFIHPDGAGINHWNAARMYWYGPHAVYGGVSRPYAG